MKYTVHVLDANIGMHDRELVRRLRKLTLHPGSGMNNELDRFDETIERGRDIDAFFILAKREGTNQLVGWAFLSEETSAPVVYGPEGLMPFRKGMGALFEVYVDPQYRRSGIGSHLLRIARKISYSPVHVVPWDTTSRAFYRKAIESKKVLNLRETVLQTESTQEGPIHGPDIGWSDARTGAR